MEKRSKSAITVCVWGWGLSTHCLLRQEFVFISRLSDHVGVQIRYHVLIRLGKSHSPPETIQATHQWFFYFFFFSNSLGSVKSDGKPMDKSRLALKTSGLQRSSSDAGKDHRNGTGTGEQRKPPSGLVRPSTGGNFGFKKPTTATSNGSHNASTPTVTSTGGSAIPCVSATVGKIPKTSGIPVKPGAGSSSGGGRKTSLDVSNSDQSGFLSPNARTSLQYRSLPRPAKTSTLTLTRPSSARPMSTTIDTGSGLMKPSTTAPHGSRLKEPASGHGSGTGLSKAGGRGMLSPSPVNQTDREKEKERAKAKAVVSDSECGGGSLKGSPAQTPSENGGKLQGLRPPSSSKGMDLPSPNTHRYHKTYMEQQNIHTHLHTSRNMHLPQHCPSLSLGCRGCVAWQNLHPWPSLIN